MEKDMMIKINIVYELKNGNGYIKIYNNNKKLFFEGEILNGKINGKDKEYFNNNKIKFEGEYLNYFKWNGKGYDNKNNIVYELKNGKGYVKEYNKNVDLEFEGEYLNCHEKWKM